MLEMAATHLNSARTEASHAYVSAEAPDRPGELRVAQGSLVPGAGREIMVPGCIRRRRV